MNRPISRPRWRAAFVALILMLPLGACSEDESLELPPDTVDARGGSLEFDGGNVVLDIPAGALRDAVTFNVTRTDTPAAGTLGPQYEFGPLGTTFREPIQVRIAFDPAGLVDVAEPRHMFGAIFADGVWQGLPRSSADAGTNEVVVPIVAFDAPALSDDLGKTRGVVWIGVPGGSGYSGCQVAAKAPKYVDLVRGSDDLNRDGSLQAPWQTVSFGISRTRWSDDQHGEKLVVLGSATHSFDNGETFPLELQPNMVLEADAGAALRSGPMQDVFWARRAGAVALVKGFTLDAVEDATAPGHRHRGFAAFIEDGETTFENCTSTGTFGFLQNDGTLILEGGSYRDWGAHAVLRGGTMRINTASFRDPSQRPGLSIPADEAAIFVDGSFGTPTRLEVDGATIRNCPVGVWSPTDGHLEIANCTIRNNDVGVQLGTPPASNANDQANTSVNLFDNTFRANGIGVFLGTHGAINTNDPQPSAQAVGRNNTWTTAGTRAEMWFGPGPWPPSMDVIYPLASPRLPAWIQFRNTGATPPGFFGASMGFDRERGAAVLFGGKTSSGALSSDTWLFDIYTFQWTQSNPAPPALAMGRMDAAIGYDPVFEDTSREPRRCVMFGGHSGNPVDTLYNDLWVFDGAQDEWVQIDQGGPPSQGQPSARYGATLSYSNDSYILIGGFDANGNYLSDMWEYDVVRGLWAPIPGGNLTPRAFHSTILLPNPTRLIVYGGQTTGGVPIAEPQIVDYGSTNFLDITADFPFQVGPPKPRSMGALFHIRERSAFQPTFLPFGGFDGNEALEFGTAFVAPAGVDVFRTVTAGDEFTAPGADVFPSARMRFPWIVIEDRPRAARMPLLFGGDPADGSPFLTDTWAVMTGPETS